LPNTKLSPNLKDVEGENQTEIVKVFRKDDKYCNKTDKHVADDTKVDQNKDAVEEQLKDCGKAQHVVHHWICQIQPDTGTHST